mmetsp:Transcript_8485/g.12522  ORF Transcript_8485/g.12522 Transcript_8485/m.12522 type:complete len:159 (+) Transcript_8485:40-516(+)
MSIGIPIMLLHEAEGHIVTLETKSGEVYRGTLIDAEDNMNVQMADVELTNKTGARSQLKQIFIRGSQIRFFILPDILKHAPFMTEHVGPKGRGRGWARKISMQTSGGGPPQPQHMHRGPPNQGMQHRGPPQQGNPNMHHHHQQNQGRPPRGSFRPPNH